MVTAVCAAGSAEGPSNRSPSNHQRLLRHKFCLERCAGVEASARRYLKSFFSGAKPTFSPKSEARASWCVFPRMLESNAGGLKHRPGLSTGTGGSPIFIAFGQERPLAAASTFNSSSCASATPTLTNRPSMRSIRARIGCLGRSNSGSWIIAAANH